MEEDFNLAILLQELSTRLTHDTLTICIDFGISPHEYEHVQTNHPRDIATANLALLQLIWQRNQEPLDKKFTALENSLSRAGRNDLKFFVQKAKMKILENAAQQNTAPGAQGPAFQSAQPTPPGTMPPNRPPPPYNQHQQHPGPIPVNLGAGMELNQSPSYLILTDKNIHALSERVGTEYTRLATYLGIPFTTLQLLQVQHSRNIRYLILTILTSWRDSVAAKDVQAEEMLRNRLKEALVKSGRNDLAGIVSRWQAPPEARHMYAYTQDSDALRRQQQQQQQQQIHKQQEAFGPMSNTTAPASSVTQPSFNDMTDRGANFGPRSNTTSAPASSFTHQPSGASSHTMSDRGVVAGRSTTDGPSIKEEIVKQSIDESGSLFPARNVHQGTNRPQQPPVNTAIVKPQPMNTSQAIPNTQPFTAAPAAGYMLASGKTPSQKTACDPGPQMSLDTMEGVCLLHTSVAPNDEDVTSIRQTAPQAGDTEPSMETTPAPQDYGTQSVKLGGAAENVPNVPYVTGKFRELQVDMDE